MGAVTWHVLGDQIEQTTTLKPGGGAILDVYNVPYMIDSGPARGHTGTVQIASTALNPETIKGAIDAQVGAVHVIAGLTS
jgi:hypothetical protein